jgi:sugar phosphate isomerase/epimerase
MMVEHMTNRLGIEMLTLLGMPPVEHVRLAAELGCVAISTGLTGLPLARMGYPGINFYPEWSLEADPALRREMKAALRDTGVHIGLGEGFRAGPDRDLRNCGAGLDIMAELGALRINAVSMETDMARTHDQLAILAGQVLARGMQFTVEFAPPNAINSLESALAVVDHVGRGRCRILIDAMHFFRSGATLKDLEALDPDLIGYAQICDAPMVSRGGTYMEEAMFARMIPGTGEFPLQAWVAALPPEVEIGIEVPRLDDLKAGISPHAHAAAAVEGARMMGA